MVIGNLWDVSDTAADMITIRILHNWLPATQEMAEDDPDILEFNRSALYKWKFEPDLLYAFERSHCSVEHYMATASLVARGLPIGIKGKVDKGSGTALEQECFTVS
jgi:hypothetical protein